MRTALPLKSYFYPYLFKALYLVVSVVHSPQYTGSKVDIKRQDQTCGLCGFRNDMSDRLAGFGDFSQTPRMIRIVIAGIGQMHGKKLAGNNGVKRRQPFRHGLRQPDGDTGLS